MATPSHAHTRYSVFISYSHADTRWANWLLRHLEGYRVPRRFHGRTSPVGRVGPRLAPVFRDRDELPTTNDLREAVRGALSSSATLVVICSPTSARSRWVQEEIRAFKHLHGEQRVFAFIIAGEPKVAGATDDCFAPELRVEVNADGTLSERPAEVVAADARAHGDGPKLAFIRLIAGLLGVGFDELRQRELQRRNRRLTLIAASSLAGMALTLGLAVFAWHARDEAVLARDDAQRRKAQAEDLLGFMLVDVRLQLEKAGRLDLLESVGDKAMSYVSSLGERDLSDATIRGKAKALTVIGVVRAQQLRTGDAMEAFERARALADTIVQRHPADGNALFDRAQAEFWICSVHYRLGDIANALEWSVRYRDTAIALVGLDPANPRWQREGISGHHNLAVIELERGNLDGARSGFVSELGMLERLLEANPANRELPAAIANVVSYLGTIAERSGHLAEAMERFEQQIKTFEGLMQSEPRTVRWQERLANSCALLANVLAITNQRAAAHAQLTRAGMLLAPLIAADPANRNYQRAILKQRLKVSLLAWVDGEASVAGRLVHDCKVELEALAKLAQGDRRIKGPLAFAWRLEAELKAADGDVVTATAAVAHAIDLVEPLLAKIQDNDELLGDFLQACVVAGRLNRDRGEPADSQRHWRRVVDDFGSRWRETANWRLLDPVARALAHLGLADESRELVARLRATGYHPIEAWPAELLEMGAESTAHVAPQR